MNHLEVCKHSPRTLAKYSLETVFRALTTRWVLPQGRKCIASRQLIQHLLQIAFGKDTRCAVLCERTYGAAEVAAFQDKIDSGYVVTWVLDQLPGAVRMFDRENPDEEHYSRGCELGLTLDSSGGGKQRLLFNHFLFTLSYHQEDGKEEVDPTDPAAASNGVQYRIVGFEVEPYSVKHAKADTSKAGWDDNLKTCSSSSPVTHELEPQTIDNPDTQVLFTYDVTWKKGSRKWADRWDLYLAGSTGDQIHWWSVGNSLMIALFMAGVIAAVLVTVLNRDISRYNAESGAAASKEDLAEETGWKLVHGDVFRPPAGFFGPMFLSVFVGGGVQVLAMSVLVLTLALLGFLSPANQGSEVTAFVLLFVFMGIAAGYTSSSVYKMFKGKAWKRNVFLTSFSLSGGLLTATAIINAAVWSVQSSMAISIKSFLLLLALWLVICVPLVAVGSYLGIKGSETKFPVRVNNIPRQIPPQPWYLQPALAIALGGVLPFGAVFVELHFVMSSLWLAQLNFVYKFLALVLLILVITCAEISIVMTYFQLCAEVSPLIEPYCSLSAPG